MHPDVSWMLYQSQKIDRRQQQRKQEMERLIPRSCLSQQIALWSGKRLFHMAIWLLRYGQPAMESRREQQDAWVTR